jgi:hypothetical protein
MKEISIDQLTNEEQFLKLKKDFLQSDEEFLWHLKNMNEGDAAPEVNYDLDDISSMSEGFTDLSDEFGVSYYESTGSFEEIKKNFYVDYLHPMIKNMPNYYIRQLDIKFIKKDILNPEDFKHFGNNMIAVLNSKLKDVENSTHLKLTTKKLINTVFDEIINYTYIKYVEAPEAEKIHFNLNKNQVVILFHLLQTNDVIPQMQKPHLSSMIQKFFRYKESEEFKDISGAKQIVTGFFGNKADKFPTTTLKELKDLFKQDNFFNPA